MLMLKTISYQCIKVKKYILSLLIVQELNQAPNWRLSCQSLPIRLGIWPYIQGIQPYIHTELHFLISFFSIMTPLTAWKFNFCSQRPPLPFWPNPNSLATNSIQPFFVHKIFRRLNKRKHMQCQPYPLFHSLLVFLLHLVVLSLSSSFCVYSFFWNGPQRGVANRRVSMTRRERRFVLRVVPCSGVGPPGDGIVSGHTTSDQSKRAPASLVKRSNRSSYWPNWVILH